MNSAGLHNKYFLVLRQLTKNSVKISTATTSFVSHSQTNISEDTRKTTSTSKFSRNENFKYDRPKYNRNSFRPNPSDSELSKFVFSDQNDPDTFGTLSEDWKTHHQLSSMPDEEGDVVETEFLNNREGKTKLSINQYAYLIKKFLNQKKIGQAIEVLETRMLKDDRVKPENYIYNLLIGACGQVGYTKKAFELYRRMRDRGLKATGHTYTGLFNACANSPYPKDGLTRAHRLREVLLEKGFLMNQTIYHAMIKAYGRCGDLETAFQLVDEMLEKKIRVSDQTFNFLFQACITDKTAGFRHALLVWRKMMQKKVWPTLFTFNLLLRCSRDCGLGDEIATQQVVQVLLQSGQKSTNSRLIEAPSSNEIGSNEVTLSGPRDTLPNLISRQPSMGSIVAISSITQPEHRLMLIGGSQGILHQMSLYKVKPDIKTFTQLLDQIPSTLENEQELLDTIKKNNISLDVDFCNMLIRKRCLRSDYANAKAVLKIIQDENLRPDIVTFGVLAMACQSEVMAHQLLADIDSVGYRPNVEILGTLVKNACYSRDCDFVIHMMKNLEKEELKPNDKLLRHLDNFYHFASKSLSKQKIDETGRLKADRFRKFCEYYRWWRTEMRPDELPHPWSQFQETKPEPEDIELMNYGKLKYAPFV